MANYPTEEAFAVSQIASFFLDLGKLMTQSKKLYTSYLCTGNLDDIQQAVSRSREILDLVSPYVSLSSMSTILVAVVPQGLLYMIPIILYSLARSLLRTFKATRQVEDFMRAIDVLECVYPLLLRDDDVDSTLQDECLLLLILCHFGQDGNLFRFLAIGCQSAFSFECLTEILSSFDTFLSSPNSGECDKLGEDDEMFNYLTRTSRDYSTSRLGPATSLKDLDFLIQLFRQALKVFSSDHDKKGLIFSSDVKENGSIFSSYHSKKGIILNQLGFFLYIRSVMQNKPEDINEAVQSACAALQFVSRTSPLFGDHLLVASKTCVCRSRMLGSREDLNDAVRYARTAMEVIDSENPSFGACLENLADVMSWQYNTTGDINYLDNAIDASSRAVDSQYCTHITLHNLSIYLTTRFMRVGRSEDMSQAIVAAQRAVDLLPPEDPIRARILMHLSDYEFVQFSRLMDFEYLERGLLHLRQAYSIHPAEFCGDDQGAFFDMISNGTAMVSFCYASRIEEIIGLAKGPKDLESLDAVIESLQILTREFPHHPEMIQSLSILRNCFLTKWKRTSEIKYIDEAISIANDVLKLTDAKSDESVLSRTSLGDSLYDRYRSTGDIENREQALAFLLEALRMSGGLPTLRLHAGQRAMDILSELADWERASKLSWEILDILVILNGRSLDWQDKQSVLMQFSHCAATYASIALEAVRDVHDVIEMLETSRGSILGHLIDNSTDLNDLADVAPEEAERFKALINEINIKICPSGNTNTRVEQTARKTEAETEIRTCLQKIRTLDGFHRFMLGPTQRELEIAAARGPIVIVSISSIRSDAIIITKDASVVLSLPELKYKKAKEYLDAKLTDFSNITEKGQKNRKFVRLQKWLWDNCVKLIFEKLDDFTNGPARFYVWWIGIGVASSLPFHAAGIYTGNGSETALSRAISSYAPTIKVLMSSQKKLKDEPPFSDVQGPTSEPEMSHFEPRVAIIIMPSTPGMGDLDGVKYEAEEVQKIVQDTFSTQILLQPSAKDTKTHMEKCEVVHFACHGESTFPDPSRSHLLLQATTPGSRVPVIDELTLRDVATTDLSHGKLALLSACSTAQDRLGDLWDEGLHLASGFQVAGYLHTIGNLWPADDQKSVQLVTEFYRHLVAAGDLGCGENVAEALNKAVLGMAKKYPRDPLSWAQFVHFGV